MKYLTLIYEQQSSIENMPDHEHAALIEQHLALQANTRGKGVYVSATELRPPDTAKSIRIRNSKQMVNDGPFAETKEYFIGYYLFDCASLADALKLAAMIPTATGGGIEVRPLDEHEACTNNQSDLNLPGLKGKSMYALLNYHPETSLESYTAAFMNEMIATNVSMSQIATDNGNYIGGYKLMPPATATSLRGENNHRQIFDGPFCEAKEVLLGLHILACESQDAALKYAQSLGDAFTGVVEVRPVNYFSKQGNPEVQWNNTD